MPCGDDGHRGTRYELQRRDTATRRAALLVRIVAQFEPVSVSHSIQRSPIDAEDIRRAGPLRRTAWRPCSMQRRATSSSVGRSSKRPAGVSRRALCSKVGRSSGPTTEPGLNITRVEWCSQVVGHSLASRVPAAPRGRRGRDVEKGRVRQSASSSWRACATNRSLAARKLFIDRGLRRRRDGNRSCTLRRRTVNFRPRFTAPFKHASG